MVMSKNIFIIFRKPFSFFSHLAVMTSNESAPIEQFLLDKVKNSLHSSIQILWLLENYLFDLKNGSGNAAIYLKTSRILLQIQKAAFRHDISESAFQNSKRQLLRATEHFESFYGATSKTLMRGNGNTFLCTGPPIIAFGAMISAMGCPQMVKAMQPLIMMQTKKSDPFDRFHNHISNKLRVSPILQTASNPTYSPCPSTRTNYSEVNSIPATNSESSGPSLEELSKGKAFSLKRYISKTAKSAKTLLASQTTSKSPPLPLMSNEMIEGVPATPPATLFPSISFYYHGDMQFISSLVAVSDRLVTLNRSNRLKALHAELCLINHNLPAPICVHAWCSAAEHGTGHHRILSILPYEASILNSAERVPFIIFIEILRECSEDYFYTLIQENRSRKEESNDVDIESLTISDSNPAVLDSPDLQFAEVQTSPKSNKIATASGLVDISERMRTAAVMLAQLARQSQVPGADLASINSIRNRIIHEMETLEKDRLIDVLQAKNSRDFYDDQVVTVEKGKRPILDKQDPSASVFLEEWDNRKERLARASAYSHLPGWDVFSVIVKSSTDMRQELLAFQLVREYQKIFFNANLPIFLRPCKVLVAANGGGLIETVPNAISVHSIKKGILMSLGRSEFTPEDLSLKGHFIRKFGIPGSEKYLKAVDNFIKSLAGYSLLTYTLQIRDRHNGNILLDRSGNLIHIDFGFMLSNSPGYVGFESAPFKLTADYLDLLEGMGSERWFKLKELLTQGLLALRKHSDQLISLLEALLPNSSLPCFYAGEAAMLNFKERLHLSLTDQQIDVLIDRLMTTSALNVFTRLYDNYQYYTNGVL
jgi:phosphatidylinositol 4-kinase B